MSALGVLNGTAVEIGTLSDDGLRIRIVQVSLIGAGDKVIETGVPPDKVGKEMGLGGVLLCTDGSVWILNTNTTTWTMVAENAALLVYDGGGEV